MKIVRTIWLALLFLALGLEDAYGFAVSRTGCGPSGNITAIIDSAQALSASYRYDSFGNLLSSSGSMAGVNMLRFSSKMQLSSSVLLYYYGYRFCDPHLQRWLNRDPIGERGGINLYGFVGISSINRIDPKELVDLGGTFSAIGGMIGNDFGVADGITLGFGTSWIRGGAIAGSGIAGKSAYGFGVNAANYWDALHDREGRIKGNMLDDVSRGMVPCKQHYQRNDH